MTAVKRVTVVRRQERLKRLESSYDFIELPVVKRQTDRRGYQVTRITCRLNLTVIIYLGRSHRPSNLEKEMTKGEGRNVGISPRYGRANDRF